MGAFDNLQKRVDATGGGIREERKLNAQRRIEDSFEKDPSFIYQGVSLWNSTRKIYPQIIEHKFRQSSPPQRKIITRIAEPFYNGEVVILSDGTKWICVDVSDNQGLCYVGTLQLCQWNLAVIASNGTVLTIPVSSKNSAQSGSGDDESSMMTVGASRHVLYVPYTSETIKFDNDNRILLDRNLVKPTAYKITQVDPVSFAAGNYGYLQWTLSETQRNDQTDNYDLMIADYFSADDVYTLTISNADSNLVVAKGTDYTLSCAATLNGTTLNQTSILFTSSDTSVATVSSVGKITGVANGNCVVTAKAGNVRKDIAVRVETASAAASIKIFADDATIIYGQSKRIEFAAYQNGVETSTTFTTSISSVTTVAEIASSGSDYVVLRAVDDEDLIGQTFVLTVSSATLGVSATQILKIGGWF